MSVVLIGKGKMLSAMIEGCHSAGIKIAGVLRYEQINTFFLKRKLFELFSMYPDKILIDKYKIPEIKVKSVNSKEFKKFLIKHNVGILFVGTWSEKLKKEIIDAPVLASINIHPSLLPKYRGANPYLEVIMHDEKETGVTFHLLDANYDTGKILAQEKISIDSSDTSDDLRNKIVYIVQRMMPSVVADVQNGMIIPIPQNEKKASYFKSEARDNIIDFSKQTSVEILRQVRAFHPWIPCYIEFDRGIFGKRYLKINPKSIKVDKNSEKIGKIIKKSTRNKSLTIVCKDGVSLKMDDLNLYPIVFSPFTQTFIRKIK
ncbi:MAG: hypothetical protein LKG27_07805 [Clostridiaceae bacterium]|jgi:methionyl-tRNA formyltransferase|nr:hypothetical protein [Clostridiaceae bacterium]